MTTRRRRVAALLTTAVALALAAGCSNSGSNAHAARLEKSVLTVAVVPTTDSAGLLRRA